MSYDDCSLSNVAVIKSWSQMDDSPIKKSTTMPVSQNQSQKHTLWEYRRMKRRLLSPVSRGLIVGAFLLAWVFYCAIIRSEHTTDSDSSIHEFQRPWYKSKHGLSLSKDNQKTATTIGTNRVNTDGLPTAAGGASEDQEADIRWLFKQHRAEMLHWNSKLRNAIILLHINYRSSFHGYSILIGTSLITDDQRL